MTALADAPPDAERRQVASRARTLFALWWGLAALFHLAGNPRTSIAELTAGHAAVQVAVGLTAIAVCLRPRRQAPLLLLCCLVPVSAWLEAPTVGNHWVLAAAVSLVYVLAWCVARGRRGGSDPVTATWAAFAPAARATLLAAYSFAAFAKLNTGFFDPSTSCAVFFQDQIVSSWGLSGLSVGERPALGLATALLAAAVELSVPVLLFLRRTRRLGLLLALGFHWSLALDLHQHFWDFSSVLFATFLLFADEAQVNAVAARLAALRDRVRESVRWLLVTLGCAAAAVVTWAAATGELGPQHAVAVLLGHGAWFLLGTGTLLLVLAATLRTASRPARHVVRTTAPVLLLVPVVVALNGLTPYLEVKTGFGWNMYSNLRTVAGETNHLVVPRTLDLTGQQRDQVEILATSDGDLDRLVDSGYAVVWSEFLEYAADHPQESVTYRRAGETVEVPRIGKDPALAADPSAVSTRVQSFRVVDVSGGERCLPVYSPAR
ncbi:MAG: hypothetical protein ACLGIV_07280 [Actinomycetes bacterium]